MKVLLATDHSKPAADAANLTESLPLREAMNLTIFSVVSSRDVPSRVSMHPGWSRVVDAMIQGAESDSKELENRFAERAASVASVVAKGQPADSIIERANADDVDLIVVGAVGHSALTRMFLGSVSDSVASHAECSVIVARSPEDERHANADSEFHVVIGFDASHRSAAAVAEIADTFAPDQTAITLVSVTMTMGAIAVEFAEAAALAIEEANRAAQEALAIKANELKDLGFAVSTKLLAGDHIGDELCRYAELQNADLLVVGDQGHGMLQRFVLGSVSQYVLRHSHRSVWISRVGR